MKDLESDAFVFFGATGDLAYEQIFPAFQAMIIRGHFDMPIIGVAKSAWNLDQLRARARESLEKHGGLDPHAFAALSAKLQYVNGDYGSPETFRKLRKALGASSRPLYYLAIPPDLFATVAGGLASAECDEGARLVVEKPFGRDLSSAQALNRTLRKSFPESAIFRIDHYLGKEPVQNLLYFRFLVPFHFVLAMQRNLWEGRHRMVHETLTRGIFGIPPRGAPYLGVWLLSGLLILGVASSFISTAHLLEALTPGAYSNLFILTIVIRWLLFLFLGIECCWWYYSALNDLRRESSLTA